MVDVPLAGSIRPLSRGGLVQAEQPFSDPYVARLFDLFPFAADLPLYLGLADAEGGRVLELGCGTGRVLAPLAEAGHRVVGLDASPHMLALAREKVAGAGPTVADRVRLVQGDMRAFELDEEFDLAIIAIKSFCYLVKREEQLESLACVAAHLRPGGLLALDLLNPAPAWLLEPAGSLRQDLMQHVPDLGVTVSRTEVAVRTDLATQVRLIRSIYEVIGDDGTTTKRVVEWPYRFTYRFEAEHLLERAGFRNEALYGGYRREPFTGASRDMVFLARR